MCDNSICNDNFYSLDIDSIPALDADTNRELFVKLGLIKDEIDKLFELACYDTRKFNKRNTWMSEKIGLFLKECNDKDILIQMKKQYEEYCALKNKIVEGNLKLVRSIAVRYAAFYSLPVDEAIQNGNIGLMKAVEKYDVTVGNTFATYSYFWILRHITLNMDNVRYLVRTPKYVVDKYYKIMKFQDEFFQKNGRLASQREIADFLGISMQKVNEIIRPFMDPVSLNDSIIKDEVDECDAINYDEVIGVEDTDYDSIVSNEKRDMLIEMLRNNLTERQFFVIMKYYGFEDRCYTNEEIGAILNVSPQGVSELKFMALKKLKKKNDILILLNDR